ncbi:hypothetical protein LCGC14_0854830 [marine sediment metagenome]|uniref:Uracil-DNA glycosylase-like domain-containing protein n=1 Tax=marine sediment metagenome TaxID=412755 RepID=A0A0F9PUD9_9ZZZZ
METEIYYFVNLLRKVKKHDLFNPYYDECESFDNMESAFVRRGNLANYLKIMLPKTDSLLVGEAPGHLGARKTGIAFSDEYHLQKINKLLGTKLRIATNNIISKDMFVKESSASFVWEILSELETPPFLWNIIPFHPFNYPKSLTNRTPKTPDYHVSKEVIDYFFEHFKFDTIYAVGQTANKYLQKLGLDPILLRHPSFGGSPIFKRQMFKYFTKKKQTNILEKFL